MVCCRGAEVDQEGPDQRTALHEAACSGHVRVAEILVNNGADPVARDDSDCTPHDLAFQNDHKEVMHHYDVMGGGGGGGGKVGTKYKRTCALLVFSRIKI